jgi:predicted CXXCH cytochrome family protein
VSSRFRDYEHVVRIAALFMAGTVAFLVWRSFMVPTDFGVYGHFRAGALTDNMQRPLVHAGRAACAECHGDVAEVWHTGRHSIVGCESCHGALARHASGEDTTTPRRPDGRTLCIQCHAKTAGKPVAFPQVVVSEHAGDNVCKDCHVPHSPAIQ